MLKTIESEKILRARFAGAGSDGGFRFSAQFFAHGNINLETAKAIIPKVVDSS